MVPINKSASEAEIEAISESYALASLELHRERPVVVDPSHATGKRSLVPAMALAAIAAGADGVLPEVHPDPARARSDGPQSLTPVGLEALVPRLAAVARAVGREV